MRRKQVVVALGVVAQIAMNAAQATGWRARSETVAQAAKQEPGFNYDESRVAPYTLPDPLAYKGGTVTSPTWSVITPLPILVASMVSGWLLYLPVVVVLLAVAHLFYAMPLPQNWVSLLVMVTLGVCAFRAIGLILAAVAGFLYNYAIGPSVWSVFGGDGRWLGAVT